MAGFDPADIERVLRIASANKVDMVTFDGAGGGSGYSPCKMINEWCLPTVSLEGKLVEIVGKLEAEGCRLPAIVITGGFASEDGVFKALAMGSGKVTGVGLCRASMAAAMSADNIGKAIRAGNVPDRFKDYGTTINDIFGDLPDLCAIYGTEAKDFAPGAIGVFSYLNKIGFGLQHFGALNRKFDIKYFDKTDLIPLTPEARDLIARI